MVYIESVDVLIILIWLYYLFYCPTTLYTDSKTQNIKLSVQGKLQCQPSVAFEYDDHFEQLLDELGIREVIGEDDEALRTMWNNLKVNTKSY